MRETASYANRIFSCSPGKDHPLAGFAISKDMQMDEMNEEEAMDTSSSLPRPSSGATRSPAIAVKNPAGAQKPGAFPVNQNRPHHLRMT
jgi:hypothetical protein